MKTVFRNARRISQISLAVMCLVSYSNIKGQENEGSFSWPDGNKAALSLSFDDARLSNVDVGLQLFKRLNAKVTFYVVPDGVKSRLDGWKEIVKDGHEIGNHSLVHPCSGNFSWARDKALEDYDLDKMRGELLEANQQIKELLGVEPVSYAYTCGQTFVGRGNHTKSYVPLIDEMFESGRGFRNESSNDPTFVDLAQIQGIECDGLDFEKDIRPVLESAIENGSWVVLAGHEIGEGGDQTTKVKMLEELVAFIQQPNSGIWLAPVGTISKYIKDQREQQIGALAKALTFSATFDKGYQAIYAKGDSQIYTDHGYNNNNPQAGLHNDSISLAAEKGYHGGALQFTHKTKEVVYYKSQDNISYHRDSWGGTVSLWLSLDPEKDLEPGYCDPVQITDQNYNDAALWVDFTDKNPRQFRMGVFGDLKMWNPKNLAPDNNPDFISRLAVAQDPLFGRDIWTHVVISFSGLNTKNGTATFYINGKYQGSRQVPETFDWDLANSKIYLGLNYVGLIDEVTIFDRELDHQEVQTIYQLSNGIQEILDKK